MEDVFERLKGLKVALFRRSPFLAFSLDSLKVERVDEDDPRYITVRGDTMRIYRNSQQLSDKDFAVRTIKSIIHGVMGHGYRVRKLYKKYGQNEITRGVAIIAANIVAWRLFPYRLRSDAFNFSEEILNRIFKSFDWKGASMEELFRYLIGESKILPAVFEKLNVEKMVENSEIEDVGFDGSVGEEGKDDESVKDFDLDGVIEAVEDRLKKIAAMTQNFGRLAGVEESNEIRKLVDDLLRERPLPWNVILRRHLQGTYQRFFTTSWRRESRKVPDMLPGHHRYGNRTIVAVDVSGSISDFEYARFCREILGVAKVVGEVVFVCWDVKAKNYGVVKNVNDMVRKRDEVSGYGFQFSLARSANRRSSPHTSSSRALSILSCEIRHDI